MKTTPPTPRPDQTTRPGIVRPSIVIRPTGNVGVILHRDNSVRFVLLGPDPQALPNLGIEDFDFVNDNTWSTTAAGLHSIRQAFDAEDRLADALEVLSELSEGSDCPHDHHETDSGVTVCLEPNCVYARADALLVDDYETAKRRGKPA